MNVPIRRHHEARRGVTSVRRDVVKGYRNEWMRPSGGDNATNDVGGAGVTDDRMGFIRDDDNLYSMRPGFYWGSA
jgi:hypothetical protein